MDAVDLMRWLKEMPQSEENLALQRMVSQGKAVELGGKAIPRFDTPTASESPTVTVKKGPGNAG